MKRRLRFLLAIPLVLSLGAAAPPAAIRAYNDEIALVWSRLSPVVVERLRQEAWTRIGALRHDRGGTEVYVREVKSVAVDISAPPGFRGIATDDLALAVPASGGWSVRVRAEVRIKQRIPLFGKVRATIPVVIKVKDIAVEGHVAIDDATDPDRPSIRRVDPPAVRFKLDIDSPHFFWNLLFEVLEPAAKDLARGFVRDALRSLAPALAAAPGLPGPVPGDGAPAYRDSGAPTPFLEIATSVERRIRRDNMPFGQLTRVHYDAPATDSWLAAYGPGGAGNPGNAVRHFGYGDSAINTGQYLAGAACRHAVTGEAEALDNVRHALAGIGRLLDVNGGTGLLARAAAPLSSPLGQEFVRRGSPTRATINGDTWVAWHSAAGISRDQYSGVYFGLGVAHDLVRDPAVQAECARRVVQMTDYLVAERWFVTGDRVPFTMQRRDGFPTFWLGVDHQRFAFLLIGNRAAPGRYDAELGRLSPLAATAWLGLWQSSFNLEHYYKFNLEQMAFFNTFRLETDPVRYQDLMRAWRIMWRYVGHHRNPHFDAMTASIDPGRKASLAPQVRESLRRFLERNHREVAPPNLDVSAVQLTTYSIPTVDLLTGQVGAQRMTLPSEPLDIPLQDYTGFFLWQKSPFRIASPGQGDPRSESTGADIVVPYWMARVHGIFP